MIKTEIKTALIRLITGIKKHDFKGCVFYTGILEDAIKEAETLLNGVI